MKIHFGRTVQRYSTARDLEYLMAANGSYCSSSLAGNTRKYHGLLVTENRLFLAGLDEIVNGIRISPQSYENKVDDDGLGFLQSFSVYPPRWVYMVDDLTVEKTLSFNGGVTVRYTIAGNADLTIRPLITDRSVHELRRKPYLTYTAEKDGVRAGKLKISSDMSFGAAPDYYWNLYYERERERGYDSVEDLFSPGVFTARLRESQATIHAAINGVQEAESPPAAPSRGVLNDLEEAGNTFIHADRILAGYHWFAESWGRDTFISLPGLLIDRGEKKATEAVFRHALRYMKDGIIPNREPDNYQSSDAALWFMYALGKYRERWGHDTFLNEMKPYVRQVMEDYPGSGVARLDGNLISVPPQTTWMDTPHTPREGKPVEVNALWVNALEEAESLDVDPPVRCRDARRAFGAFWSEEGRCLHDCIDPVDSSVRPNQVIALAFSLVDEVKTGIALATLRKKLLTPFGLRTLDPDDHRYIGHFTGDKSYHNGCVWPFLTGFLIEALLKEGSDRGRLGLMLVPVCEHMDEAGLGYISEIFEGDPPHAPKGCIAQAWSVAEIARALRMLRSASHETRGTAR